MTTFSLNSRSKRTDTSIDLTPMLDVVFILLIFFVVTASFLKEETLPINGQEMLQNVSDITESQDILLRLSDNGILYINGEEIALSAMKARITQIKTSNPTVSIIVKPTPDSKADDLVYILNTAREAGISGVSVIE